MKWFLVSTTGETRIQPTYLTSRWGRKQRRQKWEQSQITHHKGLLPVTQLYQAPQPNKKAPLAEDQMFKEMSLCGMGNFRQVTPVGLWPSHVVKGNPSNFRSLHNCKTTNTVEKSRESLLRLKVANSKLLTPEGKKQKQKKKNQARSPYTMTQNKHSLSIRSNLIRYKTSIK